MTTPMPGPWLSPQVLMVKSFPKEFGMDCLQGAAGPGTGQVRTPATDLRQNVTLAPPISPFTSPTEPLPLGC